MSPYESTAIHAGHVRNFADALRKFKSMFRQLINAHQLGQDCFIVYQRYDKQKKTWDCLMRSIRHHELKKRKSDNPRMFAPVAKKVETDLMNRARSHKDTFEPVNTYLIELFRPKHVPALKEDGYQVSDVFRFHNEKAHWHMRLCWVRKADPFS